MLTVNDKPIAMAPDGTCVMYADKGKTKVLGKSPYALPTVLSYAQSDLSKNLVVLGSIYSATCTEYSYWKRLDSVDRLLVNKFTINERGEGFSYFTVVNYFVDSMVNLVKEVDKLPSKPKTIINLTDDKAKCCIQLCLSNEYLAIHNLATGSYFIMYIKEALDPYIVGALVDVLCLRAGIAFVDNQVRYKGVVIQSTTRKLLKSSVTFTEPLANYYRATVIAMREDVRYVRD